MLQRTGRAVVIVTCEYAPFPGGIGTYSVALAAALAASGARVTVVGPAYDGDAPVLPDGVQHHFIFGHHRVPAMAVPKLLYILRRLPADALLLAADVRSVMLIRLLQSLHRRRYRVMVHGSEASKFRVGSAMFTLARRAYLGADLVAYNSGATRDIFRAQIGEPHHDAITYLGVERDWFEPPAPGGFDHPELAALPPDMPLFCSVGRLEPRKGHIDTVRALALARDRHGLPDPAYIVIGRAEDEGYAKGIADVARGHEIRTILTGRLSNDDIKRVYRRAAARLLFACALPGKIEGFGLVLLEAGAQQCPSIAAAIGGIPEVLAETGSLVKADDLCAFAAQIVVYARDPDFRSEKGLAAQDRARSFTWANCARATFPEVTQSGVPA